MVVHLMPYKVLAWGLSHRGLVRQNNEDVWGEIPELGFYVLADGMGGHQAGEVASREAVSAFCRLIQKKADLFQETLSFDELRDLIRRAIKHVNLIVYKMGRGQIDLRGMGTTICCLLFHPLGLIYAHVGDSRIYRLRKNKLERLTRDHSLLRELVDQGQLNEQQATDFLYKNIITKAVGTESKVEPTVNSCTVVENDIYLLCSDGLSDLLTDEEIKDVLFKTKSLQETAEELIVKANEKGGRDNITVVITKIIGTNDNTDLS